MFSFKTETSGDISKGREKVEVYCGIDIIEIERIKKSIENPKTGKAFVEKVYTKKEIAYCESKKEQKYQHYAVRFAGKEATFKAISKQLQDKYAISWKDIEITNNEQGRPELHFLTEKLGSIDNVDLSLSHCKEYAVANVTLLKV